VFIIYYLLFIVYCLLFLNFGYSFFTIKINPIIVASVAAGFTLIFKYTNEDITPDMPIINKGKLVFCAVCFGLDSMNMPIQISSTLNKLMPSPVKFP